MLLQHKKDLLEMVQRRATQNDHRDECFSYENRERVEVVQPGEEKALERPYSTLQCLKVLIRKMGTNV